VTNGKDGKLQELYGGQAQLVMIYETETAAGGVRHVVYCSRDFYQSALARLKKGAATPASPAVAPASVGGAAGASTSPAPLPASDASPTGGLAGKWEDKAGLASVEFVPQRGNTFKARYRWGTTITTWIGQWDGTSFTGTYHDEIPGHASFDGTVALSLQGDHLVGQETLRSGGLKKPWNLTRVRFTGRSATSAPASGVSGFSPRLDDTTLLAGVNMRRFEVKSIDECESACAANTQCRGYVFGKPGARPNSSTNNVGVCVLKSDIGQVGHNTCCMSSIRNR